MSNALSARTPVYSLLAATLWSSLAMAAEPELAGDIVEVYSRSVNVTTGGALVGLWLGAPPDPLDITAVRVAVPAASDSQSVCFSAVTRDGEYSARGPARTPKGAKGPLAVARLRNSSYATQLGGYSALDFAAHARWGTDCQVKRKMPFLPAVGNGDRSILVAAINSAKAIKVSADLVGGDTVITGACKQSLPGRSTAFDTRCTFPLPTSAITEWTLQLSRTPRAGVFRTDDYTLLLPR